MARSSHGTVASVVVDLELSQTYVGKAKDRLHQE